MARILKFESLDLMSQQPKECWININQIVRLEALIEYGGKPMTRVWLTNGHFEDITKALPELVNEINKG